MRTGESLKFSVRIALSRRSCWLNIILKYWELSYSCLIRSKRERNCLRKIPHRIGNVIGIPGEKCENILETVELNIKANPTLAIGSIFVPFPGLELTDYAIKHNYLNKENMESLPDTLYERSVLTFSDEEKSNIQKIAYLFPLLVNFPSLYYKKYLFNRVLLSLPN
jgi:hypothetical protein